MASFSAGRKAAEQGTQCAGCVLADEPCLDLQSPYPLCWLAKEIPNVNSLNSKIHWC